MKLCILLVLFYGYFCYGTDIWYQTEMSTYLVPPFQNVYTTLQQNIVGKLLTADSNPLTANDGTPAPTATDVLCGVKKLQQNLEIALIISNSIRNKVDTKLTSIMNDIAAKESEIGRLNGQIQDVNGKIQAKQAVIASAEQSVRQSEASVAAAENELRNAEKEVQDAQLCGGLIGRRKRFIGNLWNSIQNNVLKPIESAINTAGGAIESAINTAGGAIVDNVVKPICGVINVQQLDNAKRKVESKRNELSAARNQLQTLNNDLNSMRNELTTHNAQLHNLNYQLKELKDSLIPLPTEQHIILSISQKFTSAVTHLRTVVGASPSFINVVAAAFDSNAVVQSLNAVYDELQQNQFMTSFNIPKISTEQISQANINLQASAASMPSTAINMQAITCSK